MAAIGTITTIQRLLMLQPLQPLPCHGIHTSIVTAAVRC